MYNYKMLLCQSTAIQEEPWFVSLPRSLKPRQSFQQDLKMKTGGVKRGGGQKTGT